MTLENKPNGERLKKAMPPNRAETSHLGTGRRAFLVQLSDGSEVKLLADSAQEAARLAGEQAAALWCVESCRLTALVTEAED